MNTPFRETFRTASISFRNSMLFAWFLARGALSGGFHRVLLCFLRVLCFQAWCQESSLFPICVYGVSFGFLCSYVSLLMRFLSGGPPDPQKSSETSGPVPFRIPSSFLPVSFRRIGHISSKKLRCPKAQFFLGCARHSNEPRHLVKGQNCVLLQLFPVGIDVATHMCHEEVTILCRIHRKRTRTHRNRTRNTQETHRKHSRNA